MAGAPVPALGVQQLERSFIGAARSSRAGDRAPIRSPEARSPSPVGGGVAAEPGLFDGLLQLSRRLMGGGGGAGEPWERRLIGSEPFHAIEPEELTRRPVRDSQPPHPAPAHAG